MKGYFRNKIGFALSAAAINGLILFAALAAASGCGFFILKNNSVFVAMSADDTDPPTISEVQVLGTGATSTTILWKTNEKADSLINYGLDKNYGVVRSPGADKTTHSLNVENLLPNTVYYFRITSSDKSGNQGISNDYMFLTEKQGDEEVETADKTKKPGEGEADSQGKGKSEGEANQEGAGKGEGEQGAEGQGKSEGEAGIEGQGSGQTCGSVMELTGQAAVDQIIKQLENIKDIQSLEKISEMIKELSIQVSISPFKIEGSPEIIEVGTDYVTIGWYTSLDANSIVALASESNYNSGAQDPYAWKEGEPDEYLTKHEITVNGLQPATTYHYQVQSRTKLGAYAASDDRTFQTKSILPEIYNINIEKLEEESATLVWYTNVPCSSIVEYINLENNDTRSEGNPNFVTRHSVRLSNLKFDTTYAATIRVENEYGEKNSSAPITFTTIKDELPPVISKVATESTIYPGADTKIQTIINWETDEPSTCQFFYHQGLFNKGDVSNLSPEINPVIKHIQVAVAFQPATVYKFWVKCKDKTGNEGKSDDFTLLTPQKEQSIIDIIISNFQSTFGWVKKIGK